MPYIELKTNVAIAEKTKLQAALAELVTIIPGKLPNRTMVSVVENDALFFEGSNEPCAMITTLVNPETIMDKNREYCDATLAEVAQQLGVPEKRIYVVVSKVDIWHCRK